MKKKLSLVLAVMLLLQVFLPLTSVSAAKSDQSANVVLLNSVDGVTFAAGNKNAYNFSISSEGRYFLEMDYKTIYDKAVTPQIGITIDNGGEAVLDANHIWTSEIEQETGRFVTDDVGNERIPAQKIVDEKQTIRFLISDETGYSEGGIPFAAGSHTITFNMIRENIKVYEIRLVPFAKLPTYDEYKNSMPNANTTTKEAIVYEAEVVYQKSHPEIAVGYDRSSPNVTPNDPVKIKYNVLGGTGYATPGQWVSWQVEVPEDGYYYIDFKYRQNASQGQTVRRQMYVDGKVLFEDLDELLFESSEGFEIKTVSKKDGTAVPIYLTAGEPHTITLKVILGNVAQPLEEIQKVIRKLNELYTSIVVIVGETPDAYRDYDLGDHIPGLLDTFKQAAQELTAIMGYFEEGKDERNSNTAQIEQVINLLNKLSESERNVPTEQDNLRAQINTLASLVSSLNTQPLELDSISVRPTNVDVNVNKASFWETLSFRATAFFNSFVGDYNSVGASDSDSEYIDVWVTVNAQETVGFATGRDQAQIITQLVRSEFYDETGINTNISLMDSTVILQAFASGKGPDAALFVPSNVLANLYFRNAVVDLAAEMPDFEEKIKPRFHDSAFVPLSYSGKVFALPEVQSYQMLYYRTDIFERYGLTVPDTWDDFNDVMIKLQKAGMQVGVGVGLDIYEALLMQNGGSVYTEDLTSTNMASDASINAFEQFTDLYVKHSAPLSFAPLDRFRTGQIPMLITSATFYNQLSVGAIEINNLWAIAPIPGIRQEDGTINRSSSCKVGAAMILTSCKGKDRENAFKFLDWWTSDKIQQQFAFECEVRFGVAARYFPANKSTLETMSWGADELKALSTQQAETAGVPQSPATYELERNFNNAFRKVAYDYENPRDVIYRYGRATNNELTRKLTELGLIEG